MKISTIGTLLLCGLLVICFYVIIKQVKETLELKEENSRLSILTKLLLEEKGAMLTTPAKTEPVE
jgi:hypothetical protein